MKPSESSMTGGWGCLRPGLKYSEIVKQTRGAIKQTQIQSVQGNAAAYVECDKKN